MTPILAAVNSLLETQSVCSVFGLCPPPPKRAEKEDGRGLMACGFLGSFSSDMNRYRLMQAVIQSCCPHRLHTPRRLTEGKRIPRRQTRHPKKSFPVPSHSQGIWGRFKRPEGREEGIEVFTLRSLWIHSCLEDTGGHTKSARKWRLCVLCPSHNQVGKHPLYFHSHSWSCFQPLLL